MTFLFIVIRFRCITNVHQIYFFKRIDIKAVIYFLYISWKVTLKQTPVFMMCFIKIFWSFRVYISPNDSIILAISGMPIVPTPTRHLYLINAWLHWRLFFHSFASALDLKPSLKIFYLIFEQKNFLSEIGHKHRDRLKEESSN